MTALTRGAGSLVVVRVPTAMGTLTASFALDESRARRIEHGGTLRAVLAGDAQDPILAAFRAACAAAGVDAPEALRVRASSDIPADAQHGAAAAAVSGIVGARALLGLPLDAAAIERVAVTLVSSPELVRAAIEAHTHVVQPRCDDEPAERRETPAQRVERIKREKAPWSIMDDIRRYAREGFASIPDEDLTVRFRAWGLYTQGDGHGTRGEEQPFFMMRVRTPNGLLTSDMVRTIAELADRYARGTIDITNRQNFQLHWLRIQDVPTVWDELARVGWTSQGACGDNTRTVTGCPLAGVEHDEIIDAAPIALEVDRFLNGNADYANLPRKFKITITGCAHWCTYPEINDIGATAIRRPDGRVGFVVRVGGGLSTRPHLAVPLPAFVQPEELRDVIAAAVGIFRDSDELRKNRAKARMKFLFINHGWTAQRFLAEIERRTGRALEPLAGAALTEAGPSASYRDHVGVRRQRQEGLYYAGYSITSGRITTTQLRDAARLAATYGDATLRLTAMQNLLLLNVSAERVTALVAASRDAGLPLAGSAFQRGTVSCTGSEFCKLAITETKRFSIALAHELEARVPGFTDDVKLHVTGCPNSCGQHWIADVGLQGILMNRDGEQVEGYDVFVGGALGGDSRIARRLNVRVAADATAPALQRLFDAFTRDRRPEETFAGWTARVPDALLRASLEGAPAEAEVR